MWVAIMTIDTYIERINEAVKSGNQKDAEMLLEEIFSVFKADIPDIKSGTTYQQAIDNMILNANDPDEPLSKECDCLADLRLIKSKLEHHRDLLGIKKSSNTVVNNTNVNITNSRVSDSVIASSNCRSPRKKAILITLLSILASVATIVGAIIAILTYVNSH